MAYRPLQTLFLRIFGLVAFIEQKKKNNDNNDIYVKSMVVFTLLRHFSSWRKGPRTCIFQTVLSWCSSHCFYLVCKPLLRSFSFDCPPPHVLLPTSFPSPSGVHVRDILQLLLLSFLKISLKNKETSTQIYTPLKVIYIKR